YALGYERGDDIPGYMIPEVYHRFAVNPSSTLIRPILEHNAMDIHTIALLLAWILDDGDLKM
ncbi:MAG: ribonuclease H-like domain-containing protein, partial [Bacillota bacterium]